MKNRDFFLNRCLQSIKNQTYTNYEIIITENGKGMAANTNEAIRKAQGEIIKILFMDDLLAHPGSLQVINESFTGGWLVSACEHTFGSDRFNPHPVGEINKIFQGVNTIGSPSVLSFSSSKPDLFDESMSWLLDVDLYVRLFERYGNPTVVSDINVVIGLGDHQTTYQLNTKAKEAEHNYFLKKYIL